MRVNAIAPGVIDTPMTAPMARVPRAAGDAELAHIPMGRFGHADEIVGTALFLSSPPRATSPATTIAVDGGYLAG